MASIRLAARAVALLVLCLVPGCYHMRIAPESLPVRTLVSTKTPQQTLQRIRDALEHDLGMRLLDTEQNELLLVTAPRHFATDTGPGQPPGGRQYYMQLLIEVATHEGKTVVTISPHNYELRTSYAYSSEGQLRTLKKTYPYEHYPGMFDLAPLGKELDSVAHSINKGLKDIL